MQERWRQEGDNRPQAERDQFLIGWQMRQAQAQADERRQEAQEAARRQQAQQPPPEVHFHVPRPAEDSRSPLDRMGDNVEGAIRDENDSRVSQARENRRMQHAKELEAMRQEGLLKRLQAMSDSPYGQPGPAGGPIGVWNPVTMKFDYTDRVQFG